MRLISLSPSFTEILEALNAAENLVGVTAACPELAPPIARVGAPKALELAAVEALAPDVILADTNENRPEEVRALQEKFKVVVYDTRSVPAVMDAIWSMGRLTGRVTEPTRSRT